MYMAEDGLANEWHLVQYATRAVGQAGLVIVEATAVSPEGRISADDLGIWRDDQIPGLKRIADAIHREGGKIGIQLAHAGRKSGVPGVQIISSTADRFSKDYEVPHEMDEEDIRRITSAFGQSAKRALEAGFDLIEIHGAHGYLINQFLSPLVNRREDGYGGSPENRSRFLREIVAAVRREWPDEKPLGIRVSAEEYAEGGNSPHDVAALLNLVIAEGVDMVHVSSGGVMPGVVETWPGYQIPMAEIIRKETGLPVIGGGLVTEPQAAEAIICEGRSDLLFLGRELLRNPYWPLHAAHRLGIAVDWPEPYERSRLK
jgi:NADPH2 dehydrogenase